MGKAIWQKRTLGKHTNCESELASWKSKQSRLIRRDGYQDLERARQAYENMRRHYPRAGFAATQLVTVNNLSGTI